MMNVIEWIFILPIKIYQWVISPVLSNIFGMRCRYEPSCSHYMVGSIREWGVIKGAWMGLKRIGRCHPWGGFGPDPVPLNPKRRNKK
jgi:putative membrane protein insertion efficiency factor